MPILRLPENSASPGQGKSGLSAAGDKHDNGRTSSDRAGDAGGLGRLVGDAAHLRGFASQGVFFRCVCGRSIQSTPERSGLCSRICARVRANLRYLIRLTCHLNQSRVLPRSLRKIVKIANCVRRCPGSASASRAGDGALAIANFCS
jgi:hypothetical protein